MKFGTTKTVSVGLLLAALGIACLGQFATGGEGTSEYAMSIYAAAVLLAAGIACVMLWARCPSCGQRFFYQFLKLKKCPRCGKALDPQGKYVKPDRLR